MNRNPLRALPPVLIAVALLVSPIAFAHEDVEGEETERPNFDQPIRHRIHQNELAKQLEAIDVVEIAREIDALPDEIEPDPDAPDLADTALVFTNMSRRSAWVKCVGFNKNGEPVGRTSTRVPPLGLRYVLASDISNGEHFIGQVQCKPKGPLVGSVVFIGPSITDLPVRNGNLGKSRIRFPLVAHY